MSAALTTHADTSAQSAGTHPDISLDPSSSLPTLARNVRLPSTSSQTTASSSAPLSTPPPPTSISLLTRKKVDNALTVSRRSKSFNGDEDGDVTEADLLDTPAAERKKWGAGSDTPAPTRHKRTISASKGAHLTLRDQEKVFSHSLNNNNDIRFLSLLTTRWHSFLKKQHIDNLKKENFSIKLRVHFLEERLGQLGPEHIDAALKQNINLKIEVQQRGMELKKLKKLVLELEKELERQQRGGAGSSRGRERELEERLEERERELKDLRRRLVDSVEDEGVLKELETRNSELEEELENAKGLLEENMDELDRMREIVEQRSPDDPSSDGGDSQKDRLRRRVDELETDNDDLRTRLEDQAELIAQKDDEKEDLADEVDALKLEIEELQRRREAECVERSQSRAQIMEEREEREAVEGDLDALRDKLAAAMIELQQKEDELEMKNKELDDMVAEHQRIVEVVEEEWRGEVEEARGQVEELRDVQSFPYILCHDIHLHSLGFGRTRDRVERSTTQHLRA